jgi:hypothetical protein
MKHIFHRQLHRFSLGFLIVLVVAVAVFHASATHAG